MRALVTGAVQGVGFRYATRRRAMELGVMGWVRNTDEGAVAVHAEGSSAAVETLIAYLRKGPRGAIVEEIAVDDARVESHEQFAIRGVSAGLFVVREHPSSSPHFDLQLEVADGIRSWTLHKQPSLDPSVKRLAIEVPDRTTDHDKDRSSSGNDVVVWDRGPYEQGGRVPWPEAIARGHAVFVLHGNKLRGGFALQRIRSGPKPQWLLVKRRDEQASSSDVVSEQPG